jgi:histidinol-phosphatase (PHP family)
MGIAVVPGDDSHGLDSIGINLEKAVTILRELGCSTDWREPKLIRY